MEHRRTAAYAVRGLRRFAQDISLAWSQSDAAVEGRVDAEGEAIDIVSIHSAKGLEWPIVILINTASSPPPGERIVHRAEDDTLHWTVGGVASLGLAEALQGQADNLARERARLLYVGCTRAQDLLILPRVPNTNSTAYSRAVDLAIDGLPALDLTGMTGVVVRPDRGPDNAQDSVTFAAEAERIAAASQPITWLRPSAHDDDQLGFEEADEVDSCEVLDTREIIGAGRVRGLLLHKLIEEVLWEGLEEAPQALTARATELLPDLISLAETATPPDCIEVAETVLSTLNLPEIVALRPHLVPEVPVYAMLGGGAEFPVAGRADAVAIEDGCVTAVIDWKSDVAPDERKRQEHVDQLRLYLAATGAPRGALVYATVGGVRWVNPLPGGNEAGPEPT